MPDVTSCEMRISLLASDRYLTILLASVWKSLNVAGCGR